MIDKIKVLTTLLSDNAEKEHNVIELFEKSKEEKIVISKKDISKLTNLKENIKLNENEDNLDFNIANILNKEKVEEYSYNETTSNINLVLYKLLLFTGKELTEEEDFSIKNEDVLKILLEMKNSADEINDKHNKIAEKIKSIEEIQPIIEEKLTIIEAQTKVFESQINSNDIHIGMINKKIKKYISNFKK